MPDIWLDSAAYPHILDRIVHFAPRETLLTLRLVSQAVQDRADICLAFHFRRSNRYPQMKRALEAEPLTTRAERCIDVFRKHLDAGVILDLDYVWDIAAFRADVTPASQLRLLRTSMRVHDADLAAPADKFDIGVPLAETILSVRPPASGEWLSDTLGFILPTSTRRAVIVFNPRDWAGSNLFSCVKFAEFPAPGPELQELVIHAYLETDDERAIIVHGATRWSRAHPHIPVTVVYLRWRPLGLESPRAYTSRPHNNYRAMDSEEYTERVGRNQYRLETDPDYSPLDDL